MEIFFNRYPYRQRNYQATTEGSLDQHKRAVHGGIKYPCMQCVYQVTYKSHLAEHKRPVHEGVKYPSI